jgi:hypothetical protein
MWSNIWVGLGPARPNEGPAWFRDGLDHYFYTSGWHDTIQKFFGLFYLEPVWRLQLNLESKRLSWNF